MRIINVMNANLSLIANGVQQNLGFIIEPLLPVNQKFANGQRSEDRNQKSEVGRQRFQIRKGKGE